MTENDNKQPHTVGRQLASGVFYTSIAKYAGIVVTLVVSGVLARLFTPEEFGVVNIATVVIAFFAIFSDLGIGPAVIQHKNLDKRDLGGIFSLTLWSGAVMALLFFAASGLIASFYDDSAELRNPLRILDCKEDAHKLTDAPEMLDYLCEDCKAHFAKVQEFLTALGIEFEIDPGLVRGLDYYTRTVFEFPSKSLGFALGGGGRYDGLVEEFGGKPTPGLGFGLGLDRIMMALEAQQVEFPQLSKCEMYIATMGEEAQKKAFLLLGELHRCGIPADTDLCGRGLKAQMKYADKIGAKFTMVLGDNELQLGKAEMKNMKAGEKRKISISGEDFINDYVTVSTEAEDFSQDGIFF